MTLARHISKPGTRGSCILIPWKLMEVEWGLWSKPPHQARLT